MNNFPPGFSGLPILFLGLVLMSGPVANAQQLVLGYPAISDCNLNTVCWAGGQFVAAGENGAILTSSDGLVWVPRPSPVPQHWLTSAHGDGRIVLAGTQGGTIASSDGILWTPSTAPGSPQFPTSRPTLTDAVFLNGTFYRHWRRPLLYQPKRCRVDPDGPSGRVLPAFLSDSNPGLRRRTHCAISSQFFNQ